MSLARIKTWIAEVLTAADLNAEFNNILSYLNSGTVTLGGTLAVTGHTTLEGVTSTGATGTGNLVYSASPTFTGTVTAPTLTLTGSSTTQLGVGASFGALSMVRTTEITISGTAATGDIMRFLDPSGTQIGLKGVSGTLYITAIDTGSATNLRSDTYFVVATGNGATNATLVEQVGATRGTNPIGSIQWAADGGSGGAKITLTTAAATITGAKVSATFVGQAI